MTLRQEMLWAATSARKLLRDSTDIVIEFVRSRMAPDGGFRGRTGQSDLYYTVFALDCLLALDAQIPTEHIERHLRSFGGGESLDLIHTACLARCWAALAGVELDETVRLSMLDKLEQYRCEGGGYSHTADRAQGTAYGSFLAVGAYQDLKAEPPSPAGLLNCLEGLRASDGGYANAPGAAVSSTTSTAAAATLLKSLGQHVDDAVAQCLLSRSCAAGGFLATPNAPMPDLLSTATALHALASMGISLDAQREPCLDLIDSLWSSKGGFFGSWADETIDCEYTFYGLLALGHLGNAAGSNDSAREHE